MIQRWTKDPEAPLDPFDWFNDGRDTLQWLRGSYPERVEAFVAAADAAGWALETPLPGWPLARYGRRRLAIVLEVEVLEQVDGRTIVYGADVAMATAQALVGCAAGDDANWEGTLVTSAEWQEPGE